ncbi:Hsp20/alpha crystallin family protein [Bacillus sp. FSL H8-0547]
MSEKKHNPLYELAEQFFGDSSFKQNVLEFEKVFQEQINTAYMKISSWEEDNRYFVKAELPGMKKEQITIEFHDLCLTLTVSHKEELNLSHINGSAYSQTRKQVTKTILLPKAPTMDEVDASFHNGCLLISFPLS